MITEISRIIRQGSRVFSLFFVLWLCVGCSRTLETAQLYPVPAEEAEWIRQGEPIEFEGERWYPVDGVENLLDSEVYLAGEYRGVQIFVEKMDVRPYDRLYTKFEKNRFRYFEKRNK